MEDKTIQEVQNVLLDWIKTHYVLFPWRNEENKLFALIAEIMLQKTKAEHVLPVYKEFKEKYPTINEIQKTSDEKLLQTLHPLGLNKRNINLVNMLRELIEIPQTKAELKAIKGVGEYTANAILSLHLNIQAPIIDSNSLRLWSRIFNKPWTSKDYNSKEFLEFASIITPENDFKEFNYAVLDFARKICKQKPICEECPLKNICAYSRSDKKASQ